MFTAAPRMSARPASIPPVSEIRSTSRRVGQRLSDPLARTEDEVDDPARGTGLLEQPGQVDRRQRRQTARAS